MRFPGAQRDSPCLALPRSSLRGGSGCGRRRREHRPAGWRSARRGRLLAPDQLQCFNPADCKRCAVQLQIISRRRAKSAEPGRPAAGHRQEAPVRDLTALPGLESWGPPRVGGRRRLGHCSAARLHCVRAVRRRDSALTGRSRCGRCWACRAQCPGRALLSGLS